MEISGTKSDAKKLVVDNNALNRAKKAYDGKSTVMAVTCLVANIGYVAPSKWAAHGDRSSTFLGLKPALEVQGSTDSHTGDDISVECHCLGANSRLDSFLTATPRFPRRQLHPQSVIDGMPR